MLPVAGGPAVGRALLLLEDADLRPRTSPTSEAVTAAPSIAGVPSWGPLSPATMSTRSKRNDLPSPGSPRSSTSITSPGATRYCLPPLSNHCVHRKHSQSRHRRVDGGNYHKGAASGSTESAARYPSCCTLSGPPPCSSASSASLTALFLRLARRPAAGAGERAGVARLLRDGPRGRGALGAAPRPGLDRRHLEPGDARLRRSCRMVVPELSALGGTKCPGDGLGVAASGEILQELMEREFGSRPVTLLGLSLGGWMAVRLALAHPERVSRLVLVDAGGYRDQDWENDPVAGDGGRPRRGRPPLQGAVRPRPLGDAASPGHLPQGLHLAGGAQRARGALRGRHLRRRRPGAPCACPRR